MKKVFALVLAVLMLATVALAADVTPSTSISFSREDGINDAGTVTISIEDEEKNATTFDGPADGTAIDHLILRPANSINYVVTNVKYTKGKNLIDKVWLDDSEDALKVDFKDDLTNTGYKDFLVEFKLKGKSKLVFANGDEYDSYFAMTNKVIKDKLGNDVISGTNSADAKGLKANLPDLKFTIHGTVGYNKVEVSLGTPDDEEIEDLDLLRTGAAGTGRYISLKNDIIKFVSGSNSKPINQAIVVAGSYTADAMLTQNYFEGAVTLEARVYANDVLYLRLKDGPDKALLKRVEDVTADIDFYTFSSNADFVHFNSNAKLSFNNADEDCYVYQVKNDQLFPFGAYSEDDGCWVGETRTLGKYIVSTEKLSLLEGDPTEDPANANPDTGANDVVGIATALAAVALVSAAAVSLKK